MSECIKNVILMQKIQKFSGEGHRPLPQWGGRHPLGASILTPAPPFWNSAYATGPRGHTFELKLQKLWASGVFRERRGDGATPFGLIVNFCTVSASFIFRLNRKICVPLLLVTVRVFCQLKAASKCTQSSKLIILGTKNVFLGRGPAPKLPQAYAPRLFLTEILHCYGA